MHAAIWQFMCIAVVFSCINLSRWFLLAGVVRLFWRGLTPFGFTYVANVMHSGWLDPKHAQVLAKEVLPLVASRPAAAACADDACSAQVYENIRQYERQAMTCAAVSAHVNRGFTRACVRRYFFLAIVIHVPYLAVRRWLRAAAPVCGSRGGVVVARSCSPWTHL